MGHQNREAMAHGGVRVEQPVGRIRYAEPAGIKPLMRSTLQIHSVNPDGSDCAAIAQETHRMEPTTPPDFEQRYQSHLKHLQLKGLQPKTIDAYARAIRRMGEYFDHQVEHLSPAQLTDYFTTLLRTHSWSAVKHDLYGYKFFTLHVLGRPWQMPSFIRPPKTQRLPDIVTVEQAQALFAATRTLSYKVFFFTLYSLGLRLGEGLPCWSVTSTRTATACTSGKPRATVTASCRCPRPRSRCCAASGPRTATPSCCFPTATAAWPVPGWRARRWTGVACRARCARWRPTAG
jgi:hypothetical protein